jgi:two-component system, OmpR family, copper resistance phosphate regulon response regulator CusR
MRILLIGADEVLAERIPAWLQAERMAVDLAPDSETGLRMAVRGSYALVILDLGLPGQDGLGLCQALRAQGSAVPILLLAAREDEEEAVEGLESGADAYLMKPLDYRELVARVRALQRRERIRWFHLIRVADLEFDTSALRVQRAGRDITLTPREFTLLEALASHAGRTLTREIIMQRVWGNDDRHSNTVDFHIASLRKKIDTGHGVLIHTVRGLGYVLRSPESELRS